MKLGQYISLVAFSPTIDVKLLNRAVQGSLLFILRSPGMSDWRLGTGLPKHLRVGLIDAYAETRMG